MIFSVITRTPCIVFDNSYGKILSLYDTWLKEYECITISPEMSAKDLTTLINSKIGQQFSNVLDIESQFDELDILIKNLIKEKENV